MTDADFTEWEGEVFEGQFQTWLDRNREALERFAAQMGATMQRCASTLPATWPRSNAS